MYIYLAKTNQNKSGLEFYVSELGLWSISSAAEILIPEPRNKGRQTYS